MVRHWTRLLRTEQDPAKRARMKRSRVINGVGPVGDRAGARGGAHHQVPARRLDRDRRDDRAVRPDEGHPPALRRGQPRSWSPTRTRTPSCPSRTHAIVLVSKIHKPTMRAVAYARAMRPTTLEAVTRQRRPGRDAGAADGVGPPADPGAAQGARLAVPRDHRPGHRLRPQRPPRQPARPRDRAHPGVRRRALVGAPAAQPERAAAEGPAAVHPRRDGHQRAVAAEELARGSQDRAEGRAPGAARRGDLGSGGGLS